MLQVVLINCETSECCPRSVCNAIENVTFTRSELDNLLANEKADGIVYESMSEFMEAFNNEEMPYTTHFMTYVNVRKDIK